MENEFDMTPFLALPLKLHIMHLITLNHSHHEELGKAYKEMDELCDSFIEQYKGEHAEVNSTYYDIELEDVDVDDPWTYFRKTFNEFDKTVAQYATSEALKDIRIQMQKCANQLCYFLRMA